MKTTKNRNKVLVSILCTFVMLVTLCSGKDFSILANAANVETAQTIYFDNSVAKWSNVYAYVWNNTSDATIFEGTEVEDNIYAFDITGDYSNVLFKNTAGLNSWNLQTNDLTMPTTSANCYKPNGSGNKASGSWYAYSNTPATPTPTPTVTPTPELVPTITADKTSPVTVGTKVTFTGGSNINVNHYKNSFWFTIEDEEGNTKTENIYYAYDKEMEWTPEKAGTYKISYSISIYEDCVKTTTMTMKVVEASENTATIYYNNDNWTYVNIHYQLSNGNWTAGKGVAMEASTEQSGYKWKYVIDLGTASGVNVCFNDGNNSWDSKNARNYQIKAGTYGIKNETIEELSTEFQASVKVAGEKGNVAATVTTANGTAPYTYEYSYTRDGADKKTGKTSNNRIELTAYTGGTYVVNVTVTDAEGKKATATGSLTLESLKLALETNATSVVKPGTKLTFTANIENEYYYYSPNYKFFNVYKDGKVVDGYAGGANSFSFTPTEEGKYKVVCDMKDASGETASDSVEFTVKDNANVAVVYYKNSSWSNANIHYSINGTWTNLPGVQMKASDRSGYTWMYTIELGDATSATVCFNNGNDQWDSRNSANYTVKAGNYAIVSENVIALD